MGLIKTGLKAAVAVKTAHYVHDRIERRQQAQWVAQGQQAVGSGTPLPTLASQSPIYPVGPPATPGTVAPAPVPVAAVHAAAPPADETPPSAPAAAGQDRSAVLRQLKDLGELKAGGVLTEEEFAQQKALILGG